MRSMCVSCRPLSRCSLTLVITECVSFSPPKDHPATTPPHIETPLLQQAAQTPPLQLEEPGKESAESSVISTVRDFGTQASSLVTIYRAEGVEVRLSNMEVSGVITKLPMLVGQVVECARTRPFFPGQRDVFGVDPQANNSPRQNTLANLGSS